MRLRMDGYETVRAGIGNDVESCDQCGYPCDRGDSMLWSESRGLAACSRACALEIEDRCDGGSCANCDRPNDAHARGCGDVSPRSERPWDHGLPMDEGQAFGWAPHPDEAS